MVLVRVISLSLRLRLNVYIENAPGSHQIYNIRDLKIPGRDELGRLPEVNLLNRACARELSNQPFAVLVSSRTLFRPFSRRIENVIILLLFCLDKCPNGPYFQVILIRMFLRRTLFMIVVYNTSLR